MLSCINVYCAFYNIKEANVAMRGHLISQKKNATKDRWQHCFEVPAPTRRGAVDFDSV